MTELILLFAALTLVAGMVILIKPEIIFGFLRSNLDAVALHIVAVAVRLIIGALLLLQADVSKFPFAIEVIGWLSIIAAIVLAVMGRSKFKRLMTWALSLLKPFGRVGGVIASAFGAFLIYAFV